MVLQPGKKASPTYRSQGVATRQGQCGRAVGFALLTGLSLAIFAMVVLLPAYGQLRNAQHEATCRKADVADVEKLIQANERLIEALPNDDVLTTRVSRRQMGLVPLEMLPPGEGVMLDASATTPQIPAEIVRIEPTPRPAPPGGQLLALAEKLTQPVRRRGLLLAAGAVLLLGALLFALPSRQNKPTS